MPRTRKRSKIKCTPDWVAASRGAPATVPEAAEEIADLERVDWFVKFASAVSRLGSPAQASPPIWMRTNAEPIGSTTPPHRV